MRWFFRSSRQKKVNDEIVAALETAAIIFDRLDKDLTTHKQMILALNESLKSHRSMIDAIRGLPPEKKEPEPELN